MKTYISIWTDGSFTLSRASCVDELYLILDEEHDPEAAKTYELPKNWRNVVQEVDGSPGLYLQDGHSPDIEDLPMVHFPEQFAEFYTPVVELTRENLHAIGNKGCGFNNLQLQALGVAVPAKKGWLSKLIGKQIPKADYDKAMSFRK